MTTGNFTGDKIAGCGIIGVTGDDDQVEYPAIMLMMKRIELTISSERRIMSRRRFAVHRSTRRSKLSIMNQLRTHCCHRDRTRGRAQVFCFIVGVSVMKKMK